MSFGEHLEELRRRLILAVGGLLPVLIVSLYFGKMALAFLLRPVEEALLSHGEPVRMQVTGLLEQFNSWFFLSVVIAVLIGAPWVLYQVWLFVAPGLYSSERRFAYVLIPLSVVLTALSAAFTYYLMMPIILNFFVGWNAELPMRSIATAPLPAGVTLPAFPVLDADPVDPPLGAVWINNTIHELRSCVSVDSAGNEMIRGTPLVGSSLISQEYRVSQYIDLIFNLALAFAAGFQTPVVVLLLGWVGIVTPEILTRYRKHAIMACAVMGAVLTPGDPLSMIVLSVPLYLLFEFGVLLLRILPASRVAGERRESVGETTA
jgi:sec-independent protein translocase protein TatC